MASVDDIEELIATRKLNGLNDNLYKNETMSEEAFNEIIDNFEVVAYLTEYGRRGIKENVKRLQKENEEKDKQIDELVKYIDSNNYVDNEECQFQWDFKIEKCAGNGDCKDCIKQYFKKLAKEKGE